MTTVLGLNHSEANIAILVADRQSTIQEKGIKEVYGRKMWISNDGMYAFGHSGLRNKDLNDLADRMVHGKVDIQKVIAEKKFPELRELNLSRLGTKIPDQDKISGLLLITRQNGSPALYTCWPLGDVESRNIIYIGSGSKNVQNYFDAREVMQDAMNYLHIGSGKVTPGDIIRVGLEAVRYAQGKDLYSSGLDLVTMTPNETIDCFMDLQEDFRKKLKKIQAKIKV